MLIQATYDGPPYAPPTSLVAQDTATAAPVPVEQLCMTLPGLSDLSARGCLGCGQLNGLGTPDPTGTVVLAVVAVLGIGWILYGLTRK